jgi:hypothetical protein
MGVTCPDSSGPLSPAEASRHLTQERQPDGFLQVFLRDLAVCEEIARTCRFAHVRFISLIVRAGIQYISLRER